MVGKLGLEKLERAVTLRLQSEEGNTECECAESCEHLVGVELL